MIWVYAFHQVASGLALPDFQVLNVWCLNRHQITEPQGTDSEIHLPVFITHHTCLCASFCEHGFVFLICFQLM